MGPVCATAFSWSWLRLYCCIRVTDALDEGLSYFYAEVKRLKVILDAVHSITSQPVLFLIDEIYRGTNNRERLAGSEAFVQVLQKSRGLGMISTHDLELTRLAGTNGHIRNAHFQESVEDGTLHFDYQLRPRTMPPQQMPSASWPKKVYQFLKNSEMLVVRSKKEEKGAGEYKSFHLLLLYLLLRILITV